METAVIYARYSSDSQTEQSIEGQLRVCNEYAKRNNILIVGNYIDRAMTGTNDNRPGFQKMIKDSSKKQWSYVLVYKLDRFSRNKYETIIHKHTLATNGVKILSAMENIPDSPEGIILESVLEGMNQYYSAELSQKVHRGLNESYLKGLYTGGSQLYGYDVIDKKNIPNKEEAQIVKEIFTKFAQGYTGADIAKELKDRGVRTKKGIFINDKMIYKIIANQKYNGKTIHGNKVYTNIYPPLIDDNTWERVQGVRNSYKHANCRKRDKCGYLLSGKLFCGYCKHRITGACAKVVNHETKYRYYICLTKRNRKKEKCKFKVIKKDCLEKLVIDTTWKVLSNKDNLKKIANSILEYHQKASEDQATLKLLEIKKTSLSKASQNLINAAEQGIITEQTKLRLKQLEEQIATVNFDIDQERQKSYAYLTEDLIINYFKKAINGNIEDKEIQKHIIKTFIREIIVYNESIVILYNFAEPLPSKEYTPDNIENFDLDSIKSNLLNEEDLNNKSDLKFFTSNEYFGVLQPRE